MKRIFSLALAFALLCAGITVRAAQHMIVGIGNPIDPRYTPILVLDSGDWEPDALRQELPSFYPCLLKGSFRGYACPVEWDLKAIDPSLPGRQWIPGLLLPDEDFALDQGLDSGIWLSRISCWRRCRDGTPDLGGNRLGPSGYIFVWSLSAGQ